MKHLIVLLCLSSSVALAQFDDNNSFGGSSGGGGFDFTPTPSSDGLTSLGGGTENSTSLGTNWITSGSDSVSGQSLVGGGNTSGGSSSVALVTSPTWDSSLFNADNNPVVGRILGSQVADIGHLNLGTQQSFMALVVARSPLALLLDLNGDGVRGDLIDGLLYNLYFGDLLERRYEVSSVGQRSRSSISTSKSRAKIVEDLKDGLARSRIALVEELSDGRKALSMVSSVNLALSHDFHTAPKDRDIALRSLLYAAVLIPALSAQDGPIVGAAPSEVQKLYTDLTQGDSEKVYKGERFEYAKGGSALALEVSRSRMTLVMALIEARLREKAVTKLSPDILDAARAALYFQAFEIKRLKLSNERKESLLKAIALNLAEKAPLAVRAIAREAVDRDTLKRMEDSFLRLAPIVSTSTLVGRKTRLTGSALAGAATLAAWWIGGPWAVEHLTADVANQIVISGGAFVGLPVGAAYISNWLLGRNQIELISSGVRQDYEGLCEKLLRAKKSPFGLEI